LSEEYLSKRIGGAGISAFGFGPGNLWLEWASSLVRRPEHRRELPVPPLLGNRRDRSKSEVVLLCAAANSFGVFYCALSQLPSCCPIYHGGQEDDAVLYTPATFAHPANVQAVLEVLDALRLFS
jgi:hypothetical protein